MSETPHRPPAAPPAAPLLQALQITQEGLNVFQRMQAQAADLHRQFLDGQVGAQQTLHMLLEQQQRLLFAAVGVGSPLPAVAPVQLPAASQPMPEPPQPRPMPPTSVPPAPMPTPMPPVSPPSGPAPEVPHYDPPTPAEPPGPMARVAAVARNGTAAPKPAPVAPARSTSADRVRAVLLDVVSEKTGYPADMLELGMGLDADLGVDSIKRVEILSALQDRLPEAPAVKPEHLGTLHTLQDVADFLAGGAAQPSPAPTPVVRQNTPDVSRVRGVLLEVVSEKTGYPADMLELGMGLDADLGVDSIKRVEILSALQDRLPEAPAVKPEHLGTLHTLQDVADFLAGVGGTKELAAAGVEGGADPFAEPGSASPQAGPGADGIVRSVPVRAAVAAGRPALKLLVGAELWLVADLGNLSNAVLAACQARGIECRRFNYADELPPSPRALAGLIVVAPRKVMTGVHAGHALRWLRHAGPALRGAGEAGGSLFAAVACLDGCFGLRDGFTVRVPLSGSLAGLAKTAALEWPTVACAAFDLAADFDDSGDAHRRFADELFLSGPVERGFCPDGVWTVALEERRVVAGTPPVGPEDVILITGGARGVTAEAALALAKYRPTLALLGRSPPPAEEPEWLAEAATEADIKRTLAGRPENRGLAPKALGEKANEVLAGREVRRNLARLEAAGSRVVYVSADVADPEAVANAVERIRAECGPITGLVHGAGVLADKRIDDLSDDGFRRVWRTKVDGLVALLDALAEHPLRCLALFSSTTARLGRVGQAAYAAANEALNKLAQDQARRRPGCRVVAMNWGPWAGGMVTPALEKVFAAEGVGLIPLADGARALVDELSAGGPAEVVILGRAGGVNPLSSGSQRQGVHTPRSPGQGVGTPRSPELRPAFEREVDAERFPVLRSHVIGGKAVVPAALHLEWVAHAALHGNPGLQFHGVDHLRILSGVRLDDDRPHPVRVLAGKAVRAGGLARVPVEVRGPGPGGREVAHVRAEVVLADRLPDAPASQPLPGGLQPYPLGRDEWTRERLFHGPDLQVLESVEGVSAEGVVGVTRTAPPPSAWLRQPLRGTWLADPAAIDAAFQLMILWARERHGAGSLPCALGSYRQYRKTFPAGPLRVACRVTSDNGTLARADVEWLDTDGQLVARLEGCECVADVNLNEAFRRNQLVRVVEA